MAVAITLSNGRTWRMKAAALSHFKATLAHYADGNVAEDRNDHDDLVALLEPYDEAITDGPSKTDDPFRTFSEWNSVADTKAYGNL